MRNGGEEPGDGGARPLPPELDPRDRPQAGERDGRAARPDGRRTGGARRRWVLGVRIVAAALSLTILAGTGYAWASYHRFVSGVTQVDAIPGAPGGKDVDGPAENILLVGDDHRPADASPEELALLSTGPDGGGINTDTMMVLHLPAGSGAPTVISFPRDSWVDIPGFGKGKLNSAFADGSADGGGDAAGMGLLIRTIQNMTGLNINHFVRVSLLGFYDIANVLGPIQVCLNAPARDSYSGIDLPAGVSTLNAKQALSFVRQRHGLPRGDLDREVRQQYFLSTELHKVLSADTLLNPAKTQALLSAVSSSIETDPGLDILALADRFSSLSADAVTYTTIPIAGTPTITDDAGNRVSIVDVDAAAMPAFIDHILDPRSQTAAPATTSAAPAAVDPSTVTVQVVNATGRTGLAAANTSALAGLGFATTAPTNGTVQRTTTISYPAGMEAQAQAVAAHVPGATLQASATAEQVILTLGTDGRQVSASSSAPTTAAEGTTPPPGPAQTTTPGTPSCIN